MSKKSNALHGDNGKGKESELRRAFGVRSFDYVPEDNPDNLEPVKVEVHPFFAVRFPEITDAVVDLGVKHYLQGLPTSILVLTASEQIFNILEPFVHVPKYPSFKVRDLPIDCVAECLTHFVRSISPGKFQALGKQITETFGLGALFEELQNRIVAEAAQSSAPLKASESSSDQSKMQSEGPAQS